MKSLFPFEYIGGGYFRQKGIPKGESADMLHGQQAADYILKQLKFKPMKTIKSAIDGEQVSYSELLSDLFSLISNPLNDKGIEILIELCEFKGRFNFTPDSDYTFPHSRSPEQMLKFLACQAFRKNGKRDVLQQLVDKTEEPEEKMMMQSLLEYPNE